MSIPIARAVKPAAKNKRMPTPVHFQLGRKPNVLSDQPRMLPIHNMTANVSNSITTPVASPPLARRRVGGGRCQNHSAVETILEPIVGPTQINMTRKNSVGAEKLPTTDLSLARQALSVRGDDVVVTS
jgi:hypothetical protein